MITVLFFFLLYAPRFWFAALAGHKLKAYTIMRIRTLVTRHLIVVLEPYGTMGVFVPYCSVLTVVPVSRYAAILVSDRCGYGPLVFPSLRGVVYVFDFNSIG